MSYTKEELVGRKIKAGETTYNIILKDNELGLEFDGQEWFNDYNIDYCNRTIESGVWKLLPEENKMYEAGDQFYTKQKGIEDINHTFTITQIVEDIVFYYSNGTYAKYTITKAELEKYIKEEWWYFKVKEDIQNKMYKTPKGIEYGVGTQFTAGSSKLINSIDKITNDQVVLSYIRKDGTISDNHRYDLINFPRTFDDWKPTIIQDYKQVDPKTITFDFTNTKIKVNNEDKSKWVIEVANNNGVTLPSYNPQHDINNAYYFQVPGASWDSGNNFQDTQFTKYKEITIQDILNNMKEVIEVGDIVTHNTTGNVQYKIVKVDEFNLFNVENLMTGEYVQVHINNIKLVSKANKQEIVGYELLKNLPGIPAGTKSTTSGVAEGYLIFIGKEDYRLSYQNTNKLLQDTTWFKPIYKVKEVVVKISKGREVTIKDKQVVLRQTESISFAQLENLHSKITNLGEVKGFKIKVNDILFNLGCQEFTKEDIELVYQAIQDFK